MGLSAGVMLGATFFSLLLPALEMTEPMYSVKLASAAAVGAVVLFGAMFLNLFNKIIPHEHFIKGHEGAEAAHIKRIWLFIFAIALHNLPEGLAVGVGLGSGEMQIGLPIMLAVAFQDFPEGLVVALALFGKNYTRKEALWVTALTGLVEAGGALVGFFAISLAKTLLPWGLAFSAGAMLYVVSNEIIPESHRKGFEREATAGLMVGFVLMMLLDVGLS